MRRLIPALLVAGAVTLTACGGGASDPQTEPDDPEGTSAAVTVIAREFEFEPASFSLPAGTAVEIVLENQGVVEHDITVDELDLKIHANGATTTRQSVTLAAGTYTFYCSIPGHQQSGMEGSLTVGS